MNTSDTLKNLSAGTFDDILSEIYGAEAVHDNQKERYINAVKRYEELFNPSVSSDIGIFSAPGRTEIGGNHTDHQHGQVLAGAINLDAIAVTSRCEGYVHLFSEGYGMLDIDISSLEPVSGEDSTAALIRGVIAGMKNAGYLAGGFSGYITSDVLSGSGLSSSAAFESLIGVIISGLYNNGQVDSVQIAKIGQFSENNYMGKPCGLMDQTASSVGCLCYIDFKDPENPVIEKIDFDLKDAGYTLCITDTKGSHANLTEDYAAIPGEMKAAARVFGKEFLRDVSSEEIYAGINRIKEAAGDRAALRAIHFTEETKRAEAEADALKRGDFSEFLRIFKRSADSSYKYLQNVYTCGDTSHQNVSVGIAVSEKVFETPSTDPAEQKGVVRVHGGGFAGTIQAFVRNDAVSEYCTAMNDLFGDGACHILNIRRPGAIQVI